MNELLERWYVLCPELTKQIRPVAKPPRDILSSPILHEFFEPSFEPSIIDVIAKIIKKYL